MGQNLNIRLAEDTNSAGGNANTIYINENEYNADADKKLDLILDLPEGKLASDDRITIIVESYIFEFKAKAGDVANGYVNVSDLPGIKSFDIPANGSQIDVQVIANSSVNGVGTINTAKTIIVDTTPPTIEINEPIEGDNKITATEDNDVTISGKSDAEGQTVTITITDKNSDTITATAVVKNGEWSADNIDIQTLQTGELHVQAQVSDVAGNISSDMANSPITYVTLDSTNDSITVFEDIPHTLNADDFGDWQQLGSEPIGVVITELPTDGKLSLDGAEVTQNQIISMDDINAGKLTFVSNQNSDVNGSFNFRLTDGVEVSEKDYTTTIDINAIADAPSVSIESINHDSVNANEGLVFTTYTNVLFQDLHPDDYVRDSNILESFADHYAEAYSGNTQIVSQFSSESSLEAQSMVGAKGYIYLEAGQEVTFSGNIDDSALIKLGGEVILHTTGDAYGHVSTESAVASTLGDGQAISSGAFVVAQSGYYSLETYVLNTGGAGNYNIQMSVDGGATYQEINTKNFDIYPTKADIIEYSKNAGELNTDIKLSDIDINLTDTDGSEMLIVDIANIPVGATLSDGKHTFTSTQFNTTAQHVENWNLDNLTLNSSVAGTFTLDVIATSIENSNGDRATTALPLSVSVTNFPLDDKAEFIPEKCGCERDLQEDVNTGNANDYLVVGDDIGSSHSEAAKNVHVNMNGGNDTIEIDGAIDWYARVNMGDGDDVIRSGAGSIKGDSIVDMGDGDDTITTKGGIYDRAEVYMGDGDDTLQADCNIDYDAKVDMGDGDDTVTLGGGMYDKASLTLGDGNDVVTMNASINHHANLDAGSGDDVLNITDGSIRHNATVDMGDGNDTINVHYHVGNNADIKLGDGNDSMSVEGSLWDRSSIDFGSGNDTLALKGSANGDSRVDFGDGEDTLRLLSPDRNIDLTNIAEHFDNVETLDISSQNSTKITLSVSDVIDTTDSNNVLTIQGDSNDTITGDKEWSWNSWSYENQENWNYEGVENGYNKFVGTDSIGRTATILVEDTITTDF